MDGEVQRLTLTSVGIKWCRKREHLIILDDNIVYTHMKV